MKICAIIFFLTISVCGFSQTKITSYLELRGSVDLQGNIYLNEISKPKRLDTKIDSLIDYKAIKDVFSKTSNPTQVLNALSSEGWSLVSVTHVIGDKDGKPNSPFLLYYLRRDY